MSTFHNCQSCSLQTLANFFYFFAVNNLPILRALLNADTNMHCIRLQADNTLQLFFDTLLMVQTAVFATIAAPKCLQLQRFLTISGEGTAFVLKARMQHAACTCAYVIRTQTSPYPPPSYIQCCGRYTILILLDASSSTLQRTSYIS